MRELHFTVTIRQFATSIFGLVIALSFMFGINWLFAATPNPGHPWTDVGDGVFAVTGPTVLRTFTYPDASATVLTSNAAVTMTQGGSAASLTASNGGIVWTDANSMEVLAGTATAGQMLRSGSSATPAWSTATYPATAGTAANVLQSDGTNFVSTAQPSVTTLVPRPSSALETGALTALASALTTRNVGLVNVTQRITINQLSFSIAVLGTAGTWKICVYSEDGATKLIDVTSATTVLNNNNVTVSPAVTLAPGNYYLAVGCATSCTGTLNTFTTTAHVSITSGTPSGKKVYEGTVTHSSGVCNSTIGTITVANTKTPIIRFDN